MRFAFNSLQYFNSENLLQLVAYIKRGFHFFPFFSTRCFIMNIIIINWFTRLLQVLQVTCGDLSSDSSHLIIYSRWTAVGRPEFMIQVTRLSRWTALGRLEFRFKSPDYLGERPWRDLSSRLKSPDYLGERPWGDLSSDSRHLIIWETLVQIKVTWYQVNGPGETWVQFLVTRYLSERPWGDLSSWFKSDDYLGERPWGDRSSWFKSPDYLGERPKDDLSSRFKSPDYLAERPCGDLS